MIKFNEVRLTDEARSRIVLLYLGCKLHGIGSGRIDFIANEVILAGITGKKLTFSAPHVIYNAQELINFVYDYIYEEMKKILYPNGKGLDSSFLERDGKILSEKGVMLKLINKIFDFDFFDGVDDGDVYVALNEAVLLRTGRHITCIDTLKQSPIYRYIQLVNQAIGEYRK